VDLGRFGVWWSGSWQVDGDESADVPAELEALGYRTLWSTGGFNLGLSSRFGRLLAATTRPVVASGVVNIWRGSPEQIALAAADLDARHPGRFLLGLGASHAALNENYSHPYSAMVAYLDALDAQEPTVPKDRRVLAALRPRMLELAGERTAGAHPYFVPVEHTARARAILGRGPLLATEVTVVLETDRTKARALARAFTAGYLTLPNYANNLRSIGYDDDDLAGGGSERLIDAVVASGDTSTVAARMQEHFDAGADHVCVQVISETPGFPITDYRELASTMRPDG
jgi:probable F420-dependent oxidoreductase